MIVEGRGGELKRNFQVLLFCELSATHLFGLRLERVSSTKQPKTKSAAAVTARASSRGESSRSPEFAAPVGEWGVRNGRRRGKKKTEIQLESVPSETFLTH